MRNGITRKELLRAFRALDKQLEKLLDRCAESSSNTSSADVRIVAAAWRAIYGASWELGNV